MHKVVSHRWRLSQWWWLSLAAMQAERCVLSPMQVGFEEGAKGIALLCTFVLFLRSTDCDVGGLNNKVRGFRLKTEVEAQSPCAPLTLTTGAYTCKADTIRQWRKAIFGHLHGAPEPLSRLRLNTAWLILSVRHAKLWWTLGRIIWRRSESEVVTSRCFWFIERTHSTPSRAWHRAQHTSDVLEGKLVHWESPLVGCEVLRWACLYVCLFVCHLAYPKTRPNFAEFSIRNICRRAWLGSPLTARRYVMYFLVLWMIHMYSHNGANGSESTMTHMFRPVRQMAVPRAKYAVPDCILLPTPT